MRIIQIADLHLTDRKSPPVPIKTLKNKLIELINTDESNSTIVCLCGDVIYQGDTNGYDNAERLLREVVDESEISRDNLLICPGNHDLEIEKKNFNSFNRFVYNLTRNENMFAGKGNAPAIIEFCNDAFILVNSSSHLDHKYGKVDISHLEKTISCLKVDNIVMCLHHHLIPNYEYSCVINSYELINICEKYNIRLILHGHRHMASAMTIGTKNILVCGAGSINLDLGTSGYTNQFNLITSNDDWSQVEVVAFRYIADSFAAGGSIGFIEEKVCYEK